MIGEVIRKQNLRLAGMDADKRTPEELEQLAYEDVSHLEITKDNSRQTLGFRLGK
jgi:hypothetical protein